MEIIVSKQAASGQLSYYTKTMNNYECTAMVDPKKPLNGWHIWTLDTLQSQNGLRLNDTWALIHCNYQWGLPHQAVGAPFVLLSCEHYPGSHSTHIHNVINITIQSPMVPENVDWLERTLM